MFWKEGNVMKRRYSEQIKLLSRQSISYQKISGNTSDDKRWLCQRIIDMKRKWMADEICYKDGTALRIDEK